MPKFVEISQRVSELLSGHNFHGKHFQRDIKMQVELRFLVSAHCLKMLYICQNFIDKSSVVFEMWSGHEMLSFESLPLNVTLTFVRHC